MRASENDFDAIVAGAGPAGSIAAFALARAGFSVALVDKARFPRDKACGDFVGPHAVRELRALGLEDAIDLADDNRITEGRVFVDGRCVIDRPFPTIDGLLPYGCVVAREVFDERLFRAALNAGAQPFEEHTFLDYAEDARGVRVDVRGPEGPRALRAGALIGADGSASVVALRLRGHAQPKADRLIAVRAYYENVAMAEPAVELYFHRETFPGYLWLFSLGGGRANVGLGMVAQTLPPFEEQLRDVLTATIARDEVLRARLGGATLSGKIAAWPLSTYNPSLPLASERVVLAGDAAGFINPINGEGLQYAIESGRWAAEAVAGALRSDGVTHASFSGYEDRVAREIGADLTLNRGMVQLIANRALNPAWLALLGAWCERADRDPASLNVAAAVVAGLVRSRRLFEPATRDVSFSTARAALRQLPTSAAIEMIEGLWTAAFADPKAAWEWVLEVADATRQAASGDVRVKEPADT